MGKWTTEQEMKIRNLSSTLQFGFAIFVALCLTIMIENDALERTTYDLFLLSKFTDIPPLTAETLSPCGRPTLLVATRSPGWPAIRIYATGIPAKTVPSSPPQDGPPAQRK